MDIARPDLQRARARRRYTLLASIGVAAVIVVASVARLTAPAVVVERGSLWTGVVKRGSLLRQVRGPGSLVPREDRVRLIPSETEATIVRIPVLPGAVVKRDTVVMELANPGVQQEYLNAQLQVKAAEADYHSASARLQSDLIAQRSTVTTVGAELKQAALQANTDKALYRSGVISRLAYNTSQGKADELNAQNEVEKERYTLTQKAMDTGLEVQQAKLDQARALLGLKQRQLSSLTVRAGIDGVLVDLPHQIGESVPAGTTLTKIIQPDQLKATIKIPETQARDLQLKQAAQIDTHNGVVAGKVVRIDPAVVNGTVAVDIDLVDRLPLGARPDLSIDGTIDLEYLENILYVSRPATAADNTSIELFKFSPNGTTAKRTTVKLGKGSVENVEVLSGLQEGDVVILSDTSRWDKFDEITIR
jgi:HlyD family secretion protein